MSPKLFRTRYWRQSPLAVSMRWDRWHSFNNEVPFPNRNGPTLVWMCRDGPRPKYRTMPIKVKVTYPYYDEFGFPSDLYIN